MAKPKAKRRWITQGGKRRRAWIPDTVTSEQQWDPAAVEHDDWRLWQGRYWPAAILAAKGVPDGPA
jgi:hypothetical protein